ncbi:MAG TPA: ABC transporter [Erysipelotrichaceae bacterium]|nr:ABC transporter [Erysipelotrichaceae bacterium]
MLLSAQNITQKINEKVLFDHINFSIGPKDKIALIGVNGTGKSSLLKTIAARDEQAGQFVVRSGLRIHYLPQTPSFHKETIWEEIRFINSKNSFPIEEYELKSALNRFGLYDHDRKISDLSGGQQKRLALAIALMSRCDLLLLDEPTNHLDEAMIDYLENQLIKMNSALLMVTHDRYFLDRVCTKIFELDQGNLYTHEGNYEVYLENKQIRQQQEQRQKEVYNNLYKKELAWVRAGVQARSTKSKSRLDRFEELRNKRFKQQEQILELTHVSSRLGKQTIEWEDLGFHYPGQEPLFTGFSYNMLRNDRIGIIGSNGCGKSTLLKIFADQLQPVQGTIKRGTTVQIGFFRQQDENVDLSMRVIDYIEEHAAIVKIGKDSYTSSQMLERFLFPKEMHYTALDRLSGGERRRLYLLKVLMQAPNVLLLDEPTNDLDLLTLDVLEDYLDTFPGIVVAVSHDRYFLDRIADHTFVFENRKIHNYPGGYSDYLIRKGEEKKEVRKKNEKTQWKVRNTNKLSYMEKRELDALPGEMEALETEINALNEKIMQSTSDFDVMNKYTLERDRKEEELETRTLRWMELEEKKEQV